MRLSLPAWLVNMLVAVAAYLRGRGDEIERQSENRDALEEHYDEIAARPLDVDTAFNRLRDRASRSAGDGDMSPPR